MEKITIRTKHLTTECEIYSALNNDIGHLEYEIKQENPEEYKVGPIIEVPMGIIVAGIGALSAIIGSLLGYLAKRKNGQIVITGSKGRSIQVPKDTPKEDIDYYIKKAKEIDGNTINLDI